MEHSKKIGFSFGITSAIITTLGLIVGLSSSTHSRLAIIGSVLVIAIADAFSDSLGIHISEESEKKHSKGEIYKASVYTWIAKFFFAMSFLLPVLLLPMELAVIASVLWGLSLLAVFSYCIGDGNRWSAVGEHVLIAAVVIIASHYVGVFISSYFGSI